MSYELTRQALYDRVWTRPLNRIAPEFATDATRLSGLCKRFGIPTPTAGYWTKKGMGKPVDQPPLGPPPEDVGETVCIEPKPMRAVRAKPPAVEVMEQPVAPGPLPPEPPPSVAPETPDTAPIHKLVLRTHAKVAAAKAGERARVSGRGLFSVFATAVQADRIAVILSQLVRAAEHQGWAVKVDDDGIRIAPDDEPVSLQLTEQTDRIRHVPTEKEAEVVRKHEEKRKIAIRAKQWFSDWDAPKVPEWDYVLSVRTDATSPAMRRARSWSVTSRSSGWEMSFTERAISSASG